MSATVEDPQNSTWAAYRGRLQDYFDRTALDAWAQWLVNKPVGNVVPMQKQPVRRAAHA